MSDADAEARNFLGSAVAVGFRTGSLTGLGSETDIILIPNNDPNRLEGLKKAIENGGIPLGLIGLTADLVEIPATGARDNVNNVVRSTPANDSHTPSNTGGLCPALVFEHCTFQDWGPEFSREAASLLFDLTQKMAEDESWKEVLFNYREKDFRDEGPRQEPTVHSKCGKPFPHGEQLKKIREIRMKKDGQAQLDRLADKLAFCVCPAEVVLEAIRRWSYSDVIELGHFMFGGPIESWMDIAFAQDTRYLKTPAVRKLKRLIEEIKYKGYSREKPKSLRAIKESTIRQHLKRAVDHYQEYVARGKPLIARHGPIRDGRAQIICDAKGTSQLILSEKVLAKVNGTRKVTKLTVYAHGDEVVAKGREMGPLPSFPFAAPLFTPVMVRFNGKDMLMVNLPNGDPNLAEAERLFNDLFATYLKGEPTDDLLPRLAQFIIDWSDLLS